VNRTQLFAGRLRIAGRRKIDLDRNAAVTIPFGDLPGLDRPSPDEDGDRPGEDRRGEGERDGHERVGEDEEAG
jgi:hypothetical protein